MKKIDNVNELVRAIERAVSNGTNLLEVISHSEIPRKDFERYYSWNDHHYSRVILAKNEDFEILLVCWEKGQCSPIHDFNSQEAWIHPIEGRLREERFIVNRERGKLEKVSNVLLGTSEFTYMNQIGIHRYSNVYNGRSVSLHVYQKPVENWQVYFSEEDTYSNLVQTSEARNYNLLA